MNALKLYKISRWFFKNKMNIIAKIVTKYNNRVHNSYIPYTAVIGEGSIFAYGGIGVVIHNDSIIGKNCVIGQGITIGGRGSHGGPPIIGDNVYIGPGARILGKFRVEDNSIIAPNAVVISEVKENSIVAGIPAKLIKKRKGI